jgi:hypothetical protein
VIVEVALLSSTLVTSEVVGRFVVVVVSVRYALLDSRRGRGLFRE